MRNSLERVFAELNIAKYRRHNFHLVD
jgi:hypothetical protein